MIHPDTANPWILKDRKDSQVESMSTSSLQLCTDPGLSSNCSSGEAISILARTGIRKLERAIIAEKIFSSFIDLFTSCLCVRAAKDERVTRQALYYFWSGPESLPQDWSRPPDGRCNSKLKSNEQWSEGGRKLFAVRWKRLDDGR